MSMTSTADLAQLLTTTLGLDAPPVAIRFVTSPPAGVTSFADHAPAGCALWRRAEAQTFFASPAAHRGCAVGMYTHGLTMDQEACDELTGLIGQMAGLSYLGEAEVPAIPTVAADRTGADGGVVYGPLSETGTAVVDAVVLWVTPAQAMLLNEATGGAAWGSAGLATFGRPACAAIPTSVREGRATLSLGCAGMRTFTEIAGDRMLAVLPGSALASLADSLQTTEAANASMRSFYAEKKAASA